MGEERSRYCIYFQISIFHNLGQLYRTCFFSSVFSRLQSLWNFWIASQPSSAQTFFLLVLLLSTMLCLSLNLWNQFLLPLNFAASAAPQHASIFDLFPAILLLCLIGLFFVMVRVSSARILLLFFSHLITSDLLTPCCFATVLYLSSKRSSVFFMKSTV